MNRPFQQAWRAVRFGFRACPGWLTGSAAVTLLNALVPVAPVWLLKNLLDALAAGTDDGVALGVAGLVVVGLLAATLPSLSEYLQNEVARRVGRRAQSEVYTATARMHGLARLEDPEFHDRLRLGQSSGRTSPGQVAHGVLGTAQLVVTVTGLVVVLAAIGPVIAAIVLLGLVPALMAEVRLSRSRAEMLWRVSPHERREFFYAELQSSIPAAKELRLLGLSELFRQRMLRELAVADTERRRVDGRQLRVQFSLGLVSAAVLAATLVWAVRSALSGALTVGEVSALVAAVAALQSTLASLVGRISVLHHALLMFDHFCAVLDAGPDLPVAADPQPVPPLVHAIELRDVWFRYAPDQDWVLRGVNLRVPYGTAVGLVGLNGAGKSTIVKLLCRFYDPDRGAVLWDGVDVRRLDLAGLRARIGALFQDYMCYELTAAENIGLGDLDALSDRDRVRAAAGRADIDGVVDALPRGFDTMLSRTFAEEAADDDAEGGGSGVVLSGGQWQRLALARTFLRDRRDLLILDEPSSGLDAEAEYTIHHRLREHRAGATSLLISHRLGAIRDADTIVVLDRGTIVESGPHTDLMAADGGYARLFRMQADGYREEAVA